MTFIRIREVVNETTLELAPKDSLINIENIESVRELQDPGIVLIRFKSSKEMIIRGTLEEIERAVMALDSNIYALPDEVYPLAGEL